MTTLMNGIHQKKKKTNNIICRHRTVKEKEKFHVFVEIT